MSLARLAIALGLAVAAVLPSTSRADPVFSCPDASKCNGNTYAVSVLSHVGNTWQVQVSAQILSTYTGNQWTDLFSAIGIKNMAPSVANASLVSGPSGPTWTFYAGELNNGGAICANDNSPGTKMCAWAGDGLGAAFTLGDTLNWVFQFDAASLYDTIHLKFLYVDGDGKKVGSLGSFDLGVQNCGDDCTPQNQVPEPGTLALLGVGLLGLAFRRRAARS